MYCEKCGAKIDADAKFCPNCGNNFKETQNPETASSIETSSGSVKKKKSKLNI